ncbi:hypothetical protein [Propioniciclava soli]|uniref:hypothetical protein n=1 Tax=Propioniciclava soli TaxID=2775081 RepID=UPI001E4E8155|nr:hypothetical protein [Propioniciclava soli]
MNGRVAVVFEGRVVSATPGRRAHRQAVGVDGRVAALIGPGGGVNGTDEELASGPAAEALPGAEDVTLTTSDGLELSA